MLSLRHNDLLGFSEAKSVELIIEEQSLPGTLGNHQKKAEAGSMSKQRQGLDRPS
jgi:hypothetical protein